MNSYTASEKRYNDMKYNRCGNSGLLLPAVSFGLWHNFGLNNDFKNMKQLCFTAFDSGITHFDLANNYGPIPGTAEANFGKILNSDLKTHRDELIISTKAGYEMWDGPYGNWGSRKYLIASLDQSLKRLGIDYVDIFYHHRMDPDTPLEETMLALDQIVRSGKALYVGLSNYDGDTMVKAAKILKELHTPFIINQNLYNMVTRLIETNGLKEEASKNKKGIITFSPLAQGLLTNRYLNGVPADSRVKKDGRFLHENDINDIRISKLQKLDALAKERGQTLAQMALSWNLKDDDITSVLIGASKPSQILDCIKCIENTNFTKDELEIINSITKDF
ncbi:MAG: aldo/keto reductase [Agathobacter sp.]|nr:aldo/keto reductase [Agathobacter sp.]